MKLSWSEAVEGWGKVSNKKKIGVYGTLGLATFIAFVAGVALLATRERNEPPTTSPIETNSLLVACEDVEALDIFFLKCNKARN